MTAIEVQPDKDPKTRPERSVTTGGTILRLLGLVVFTAFSSSSSTCFCPMAIGLWHSS